MKLLQSFLIVITVLLTLTNSSAQVSPAWATSYTYNFPDYIGENDMVADKDGNIYVTGHSFDTALSNYNILILKYNTNGILQWTQQYDSIGYQSRIAVDRLGNVYIGSSNGSDLLTIKFDALGSLQWVKAYSGVTYYNVIFDIATDDSCNVYVTGNSHGDQFTTLKYDVSGNLKWAALDGPGMGLDYSYITLDSSGNVYIAQRGYDTATSMTCNTIKYNSLGVKQWEQVYHGNFVPGLAGPRGIKYDSNGFIYTLAYTTNNNDGEGDVAVVKYDTLGNLIWVTSHSFTPYYDTPKAIDIDKYGNVYAACVIWPTGGTIDSIATIKFDMNGVYKWSKTYSLGYYNNDEASAIAVDSLGNIYVTGLSSDSDHHENFVTIRYDSLGNEIWVGRYQSAFNSNDFANSISLDDDGNVYVSGTSYLTNAYSITTIKYGFMTGVFDFTLNSENDMSTYPNPFETYFTITVKNEVNNAYLIMYNVLGNEVLRMTDINGNLILVERNGLASGIYFYKLWQKGHSIGHGKIIAK